MVLSLVLWRAWSAAANCPSIDSQPPTADSEREVFAVPEEYVEMVQCWGQDYIFSRVRATGDGGCHDQTGASSPLLGARMFPCSRLKMTRPAASHHV